MRETVGGTVLAVEIVGMVGGAEWVRETVQRAALVPDIAGTVVAAALAPRRLTVVMA
jgi:hypothetical protein